MSRTTPARFRVEDEGDGVISASVEARFVRRELAERLCVAIEKQSEQYPGEAKLLMDLGALSRASPSAGIYAMRRMKALGLQRIAFTGGNVFMRGFARTVMTMAGFRYFSFFRGKEQARTWLCRLGQPR